MKTKIAAAALALASLFTNACEQPKWEETKVLFTGHSDHGDKSHGHDEKADEQGKTEAHGEKKADGHGEAKH